jgi:hypothetical protein
MQINFYRGFSCTQDNIFVKLACLLLLSYKKQDLFPRFFNPAVIESFKLKGTWQRGGFSGVFAEIGSA